MCRALIYLGQPVVIDDLLFRSDSSLINQTYMPKMLHMNLAGFGMMAWDRRQLRSRDALSLHLADAADLRPQLEVLRAEDPVAEQRRRTDRLGDVPALMDSIEPQQPHQRKSVSFRRRSDRRILRQTQNKWGGADGHRS